MTIYCLGCIKNVMNLDFYVFVAISAGTGTATIELLLKLFLNDFIKRRYHKYVLQTADKRECSKQILDLVNIKNSLSWSDINNAIYNTSYLLSDRLITLNKRKYSIVLDNFVNEHRKEKEIRDKLFSNSGDPNQDKINKEFLNNLVKIDKLRNDMVNVAKELQQ